MAKGQSKGNGKGTSKPSPRKINLNKNSPQNILINELLNTPQKKKARKHDSSTPDSGADMESEIFKDTQETELHETTFKKINYKSKNRRQKKTKDLEENTPGTPDRTNRTLYNHNNITRFTVKLSVKPSNEPERTMLLALQELITELIKADTKLQVYTWKENSPDIRAKEAKDINTIPDSKKFFSKLFVPKQLTASTIYTEIRIGHDNPIDEIRKEMQNWLRLNNHGLYYKMLQTETSAEIGWLLYSTREMDAGALADEMADILGMQVGLRWKTIDIGLKGKIPDAQKVMALMVEVDASIRWSSQRRFIKYFGRTPKQTHQYPNGIRLRFVKFKKDALSTQEKTRIERLRIRQKHFLASVDSSQSWDIEQLDYADPTSNDQTLRQMIMDIKSTKFTTIPLFHCVDLNWMGNGYIFQYCPNMKDEAEVMIQVLLPYLRHRYPDSTVEQQFTTECIARCETLQWDIQSNQVIDSSYDDTEDYDADDDVLIGFSLKITETDTPQEDSRPEKNHTNPSPYDEDSVPTIGEQTTPSSRFNPISSPPSKAPNISTSTPMTQTNTIDDSASTYSNTSTITMETIATINNRLDAMVSRMNNTDTQFSQIMQALTSKQSSQSSEKDRTPTEAESAGGHQTSGAERV